MRGVSSPKKQVNKNMTRRGPEKAKSGKGKTFVLLAEGEATFR